jgi:hypothetical protein
MQSLSVTLPVSDDVVYESNETVVLALANPTGGSLGAPLTATVTISDDEDLPTVQFDSAVYTAWEAAGGLPLTVTLSGGSAYTIQVAFSTTAGTAGPADFAGSSRTLAFAPGATSLTVTVPLTDDLLSEGPETFTATLSLPINAALGAPNPMIATILDDEPPATASPTTTATATVTKTPTATATATETAAYRLFLPLVKRGPNLAQGFHHPHLPLQTARSP